MGQPKAEQPPEAVARPARQQRVRVQRSSRGRGGKTVTAITGLELPEVQLKALAKTLKVVTGTGGSTRDGVIELQGDQVQKVLDQLVTMGYRPKRSGG